MAIVVNYIIPLVYAIVIVWLLQRGKLFKANNIPAWYIALFFVAKCMAGFLYSYIALKYIPNRGDIWVYYDDGLELYRVLFQEPARFGTRLQEMFSSTGGNILDSQSAASQSAFEGIKLLQFVLNLFSFGNLYTNTILFNGLAVLAFLRCWIFLKVHLKTWSAGAWLFLFPSAFFYTSGIHKEGILFILIALLLPVSQQVISRVTGRKLAWFLSGLALFFFFKFFVAMFFAASMVLYWWLSKKTNYTGLILLGSIIIAVSFFFISGVLWPAQGLPQMLVQKQQEFLEMEASSAMPVAVLEPNFRSFLKAFPQAIFNVLLRPLPGEGGKTLYLAYSVEIYFFWIFLIFLLIRNHFRFYWNRVPPMLWALFLFACANLLIIGYTIHNIGATMRYRSIFLPFVGLLFWFLFHGAKPDFHRQLKSKEDAE